MSDIKARSRRGPAGSARRLTNFGVRRQRRLLRPGALTRRMVHFQIKDELRGVGHRHVPPVFILLGFFRRPNRVVHGFSRVPTGAETLDTYFLSVHLEDFRPNSRFRCPQSTANTGLRLLPPT